MEIRSDRLTVSASVTVAFDYVTARCRKPAP
jgi:hypothetical protein